MAQQPPDDFPKEERLSLQRAVELLRALHEQAGRIPAARLLKWYLDETDYLALLEGAGQNRAVRNVRKLLSDVQRAGFVRIEHVLEWAQLVNQQSAREGEAPVVAEGAVQIMTVHRAKGLEFPIVVLGAFTQGGGGGDERIIVAEGWIAWKVPSPSDDKPKPAFFEALFQIEKRKEEAEKKRLFYVAATRAEDYLIFNGVVNSRNQGPWYKWLKLALPELDALVKEAGAQEQICRLGGAGAPVRCRVLDLDDAPHQLSPVHPAEARTTQLRIEPGLLRSFQPEMDALDPDLQQEREPERRVWRILPARTDGQAWAPSWIVGRLVHRAIELERMPDAPGFAAWLEASARSLGLSDEAMIRNAVGRATRLLKHLAASPLWADILNADQVLHEVPYAYIDPGEDAVARGTIDLLYRTGEDWTLVDFKTDRARDRAEMEAIITEKGYDEQVRRYAEAVRALLDVTPRAVVCFLDVAGEVAVYRVSR